ncbi:isochorismatase family protein [Saccharopolyspora sp. K220]|uniref:isochorismatase family protein n=1 Tax=Saccharopolyspora soli TaxID=2926618 RepID=UPI001F5702C6|nr:isochorismatase family protein [Saccharopolyspora soli]MCI2415884.1 isochorismatase family protein [Saccharopolyspora soli]
MTDRNGNTAWADLVPAEEQRRLRAAGFGDAVPMGLRPCLVVVDVTLSFLGRRPGEDGGPDYPTGCGPEGWRRLPAIRDLLGTARNLGIPRVLTRGAPDDAAFVGGAIKLSRGPETARLVHGAPFPPELEPRDDEYVLAKAKASAFFGTPLLTYLHAHLVDTLIVTGTTTSGCVRATVVDGASHGYRVLVVEDACFDRSPFAHAANLFDIQMKYGSVVDSAWVSRQLRGCGDQVPETEPMGLPTS